MTTQLVHISQAKQLKSEGFNNIKLADLQGFCKTAYQSYEQENTSP